MTFDSIIVGCMKLGKWGANMNENEVLHFIESCIDVELCTFDHADIYGDHTTERLFGEAIKHQPDIKNKIRVITKCGIAYPSANRSQFALKHYNASPKYILTSIEESLRCLRLEKIDVFLLHRPDVLMHPELVAEVIEKAKQAGKIEAFGVSNFSTSQFLMLHSLTPLITNQLEASVAYLNPFMDGTFDQLLYKKVIPTIWSPLSGGKVMSSQEEKFVRIRKVGNILKEKYNCTLEQLLLAWLMKHPAHLVPVVGTTKIERLSTLKQSSQIHISHEDWYQLWTASTGYKVP